MHLVVCSRVWSLGYVEGFSIRYVVMVLAVIDS